MKLKTLLLALGLIAAVSLGCEKKSETPAAPTDKEMNDTMDQAKDMAEDAKEEVEEAAEEVGEAAEEAADDAKKAMEDVTN